MVGRSKANFLRPDMKIKVSTKRISAIDAKMSQEH